MTKIAAIISYHNKQVLKPEIESYGCNCRDRDSCPMENQCLTPQIVYRADVSNNKDNETVLLWPDQKHHLRIDMVTTRGLSYMSNTKMRLKLLKYIWDLTSSHKVPTIKWYIVRKMHRSAKSDFCKLCLTEKCFIIK